ncbi:MAG: 50S ribosomal protein L29 [Candidatus Moranbacteria bacterium]|nr:50S ribosomal protein L29 [Candidatus Moranbacteria bacterium]
MQTQELKKLTQSRLRELEAAERKQILDLSAKFAQKGENQGNVRAIRHAKKNLARILTIINQKSSNES